LIRHMMSDCQIAGTARRSSMSSLEPETRRPTMGEVPLDGEK
jgi:hypothetical protein